MCHHEKQQQHHHHHHQQLYHPGTDAGYFNGPPLQSRALGLDALHKLCRDIYPEQSNPLTVTAVVKFWLGGPDPLDYISMYENPGCPELGIPPHWHYVSLGLSDLHGDGRLYPRSTPGQPSGFGFELTFRLVRQNGEVSPPTWPANVMQQLAKYVFSSGNMLMPGDHVSWHAPLDAAQVNAPVTPGQPQINEQRPTRITQILMGKDPQLQDTSTPYGDVTFVQIVGVTSEELQATQHWNGLGVINLLQTTKSVGKWLVTDMRRSQSIMEEDPSIAEKIQNGIEREGSNLSGVSAKCWWVQVYGEKSTEKYREKREDSEDEEEEKVKVPVDEVEEVDIKPNIKSERLSPCEQDENMSEDNKDNSMVRTLEGLHLTFNLEAGSLLPLAIKGRVMHGRHFTFKSFISHTAITIVAPSVTGTLVSKDRPYVVQGPWLQVLLSDELAEKMANEFQILSNSEQLQLPKTFTWPEQKLVITIVND